MRVTPLSCFSFLFVHIVLFSKNCVSSFSFKYVSLPALVSEFNSEYFLRSVLATQDGTAGMGLGRLLGEEHASTPQSGVEAPRLLKRSLSRLYYCLFVCLSVCLFVCLFVSLFLCFYMYPLSEPGITRE